MATIYHGKMGFKKLSFEQPGCKDLVVGDLFKNGADLETWL